MTTDRSRQIVDQAREMGAALAGIASVQALKRSPSHLTLTDIRWPPRASSALVVAVSLPQHQPELDWWAAGDSPANQMLARIVRELSVWIEGTLGIKTHELSYQAEDGGMYVKDAAVLAGLGCIGRNNLLVTPEFGPRVRLHALLLEAELPSTSPTAFDPCENCQAYCRLACPQKAYERDVLSDASEKVHPRHPPSAEAGTDTLPGRDGSFGRSRCMIQMRKDVAHARALALEEACIKYCRRCELACPVGRPADAR